MITGNKGEWSEIYALFTLLGDKNLYLGNKEIEKIQEVVYPILKVLRTENNEPIEYSIQDEIILISDSETLLKVPIEEFKNRAKFLLERIKETKERTFSIPEIESFMLSINCLTLKAGSTQKTDITIIVHDQRTNQQPTLGFSIKSQLGSPSTLLNAGKTTNFIYEISGGEFSENEIDDINSISTRSKIKDRINNINHRNASLNFVKTENAVFANNLTLIDSRLPEILGHLVLDFYSSNHSKVIDLTQKASENNPLNFDYSNNHQFYEYKIKKFLTDTALGMMPSAVWTGNYDATGGYLIVKEDGDVLCYHIYNRNEFENYLFNNTKFETASSTRHNFGLIYKSQDKLYFKLNLQIRFLK